MLSGCRQADAVVSQAHPRYAEVCPGFPGEICPGFPPIQPSPLLHLGEGLWTFDIDISIQWLE